MNSIRLKAFAKINLILDIPCVLANGYHSIYTVMQSVGIYDEIYVRKVTDGFSLVCNDSSISCGASNTVAAAVEAFEEYTGISCSIEVNLQKNIPSQAGLGGGSSDAAATINALNLMYKTHLSEEAMREIALSVGADVPFCIRGGTALCQNIGEVISPLPDFPDTQLIIVKPESSVQTQNGYAMFDALHSVRRPKKEEFLYYAQKSDLHAMCERVANVFEQAVDVSARADIKSIMRRNGSLCSCMSGSGSAVFGIFEDDEAAEKCKLALEKKYRSVYKCKRTLSGCEIISVDE